MLLERTGELEVTIAQSAGDLETLTSQWRELWRRDKYATPFQAPAWLLPWARYFTAGEFCCVAARADDRLVAFVPTFTWQNPDSGECELLLLGTGLSDYCGALCADGYADAISAGLEHLSEVCAWDVLNFQDLRHDSSLLNEVSQPQSSVPVLALPREAEKLHTVVPKAQLQNIAYYRRRAQRIGECEWQMADEQSLDVFLDELFALHSARWQERADQGAFADTSVRAFHRAAARGLLDARALRLHRLTIGSETVAVLYAVASGGCTYYYSGGFNPEFANVSPGTLVIAHAIEQAVREGCTRFDFLRGAERYKYLWGAKDTRTFRRRERRECRQGPAVRD